MIHIMIDLETLDTRPSAIIAAIGAVAFDKTTIVREFYKALNMEAQVRHGRTISRETLLWWLNQDKDAIAQTFVPANSADLHFDSTALQSFCRFYHDIQILNNGEKPCVWGNGADFDVAILASALQDFEFPRVPWGVRSRCYRTLKNVDPLLKTAIDATPFVGVKHNALHDARHQVGILQSLEHIRVTL